MEEPFITSRLSIYLVKKQYNTTYFMFSYQAFLAAQSTEKGLCIPRDYQKYDLPSLNETTYVTIGVHLKDIPKVCKVKTCPDTYYRENVLRTVS